jgi:hypothetical protein
MMRTIKLIKGIMENYMRSVVRELLPVRQPNRKPVRSIIGIRGKKLRL